MKKIKKVLICFGTALVFLSAPNNSITVLASESITISPRADIIEWVYRVDNGKMYRRQYNYSKNKWLGSWEYIADVS